MEASNIIPFKQPLMEQTQDSRYMELIDYDELRKKYWSHICPNVGMVSQPENVCPRCQKTKPEGKE